MALTLALSDNANGTGFTAAVAGSSGATVSVWYTPADRPWPGDAWILAGTRVGDGAFAGAVDPRFYFVYASAGGTCSPPERVAVTTGFDEVATLMQNSIVATIRLLALPSISDYLAAPRRASGGAGFVGIGAQAFVQQDWTERKYPCFSVALDNQTEAQENGSNGADDIVYPFSVMLYDTAVKPTKQDHRAWIQWCRAKVFKAFRNQHLAGVTSSVVTRVEPKQIVQRQFEDGSRPMNLYGGGFVVRCVNRELRGLGA